MKIKLDTAYKYGTRAEKEFKILLAVTTMTKNLICNIIAIPNTTSLSTETDTIHQTAHGNVEIPGFRFWV